jgi:hypothetical protein
MTNNTHALRNLAINSSPVSPYQDAPGRPIRHRRRDDFSARHFLCAVGCGIGRAGRQWEERVQA